MTPPISHYLLLAIAFALGAIPFGFLAGRVRGIDIREHGSKNIGATNIMRVLGVGPGVVVLLLDALKGYLPTFYAAHQPGASEAWIVATGLCAVLGHIYSPWVRFRGGKGVATSLGVLIALSPAVAGITFAVFVAAVAVTRWVALGSILGAFVQAILFFVLPYGLPYRLFSLVVALFVIVRHRSNIQRILRGTESRFGEKKPQAVLAETVSQDLPASASTSNSL